MQVSGPSKSVYVVAPLFLAIVGCIILGQAASVVLAQERPKITGPSDSSFHPQSLIIQGDGKILAAGSLVYYEKTGPRPGMRMHVAAARFGSDGAPDSTFGDGGISIVHGNGGAGCLVWDGNDRILVGGEADRKAALFALSANGQLDTKFGDNGVVAPDMRAVQSAKALDAEKAVRSIGGFSFGAGSSSFRAVARSDSGEVFAAASVNLYELVLFSFEVNGSLNKAFGGQGFARTSFKSKGGSEISANPESLLLLPDGRLLLGGSGVIQTLKQPVNNALVLARYLKNGQLDSSFGQAGKVIRESKGTGGYVYSMVLQADEKLLVASSLDDRFVVARYARDGKPDPSFGESGEVILDAPYSAFSGAADRIQFINGQEGKTIRVGGFFMDQEDQTLRFYAIRLNADGTLDKTFTTEGKLTYKLLRGTQLAQAAADRMGNMVVVTEQNKSRILNVFRFDHNGHVVSTSMAGENDAIKKAVQEHILRGKDVNGLDERGELPLGNAVRQHSKEIVAQLIALGADVNARNKRGDTALLEVAGDRRRKDIVELLISKGAKVNVANSFGQTPLALATQSNATEIMEVLLFAGAEVDSRDNGGETPLMRAQSKEGARILLSKGTDVNASDKRGRTALIRQASNGNKEAVEALVSAGADISVRSNKGETALSIAESKGHAAIVQLLKEPATKRVSTPTNADGSPKSESRPVLRAVTIEWVDVGNPGNRADTAIMHDDTTGYGSVAYKYRISKYDVTNDQYVQLLNAKDPKGANALGLYNKRMGNATFGGIKYNAGDADGGKYNVVPGRGNYPVTFITWNNAIRFANWLNNGQGDGDTESGAYTLVGGTPKPSNGDRITRNPGAKVFLPNENEWYKAAYYNSATGLYFKYGTSSDTAPTACPPRGAKNSANYRPSPRDPSGKLTEVGAYAETTSPCGAFDMSGNVLQWNETLTMGGAYTGRCVRGGSCDTITRDLLSAERSSALADLNNGASQYIGFRVASVP
jgi:formylglycine-generating enzyme